VILASLAALLCIAPAAGAPVNGAQATPAETETERPAQAEGNLLITSSSDSSVTVRDRDGRIAASHMISAGQTLPIALPVGKYTVSGDYGSPMVAEIAQESASKIVRLTLPPAPVQVQPPMVPLSARAPAPEEASERPQERSSARQCGGGPCRGWKRIAAPLMSAVLPGSGQIVNNEPGKGAGMFLGAVALGGGAAALHYTRDPLDNSSPQLGGSSFGSEMVNAAGFGMLTGGLTMLYAAQIMDAYASAVGKDTPTPQKEHRVGFQLTRMATVGFRAGDPAAALYSDWNLNFLVQVRRRFSVGLTDVGLKYGFGRTSLQAGARLHYRFYDRGRIWLGGAIGTIFQGTLGRRAGVVGDVAPPPVRANAFAAIPYGQLDLRLFLLDRWSLDLIPRISVPLGTRFYREDLALPTKSVTFELGTGVGVYF